MIKLKNANHIFWAFTFFIIFLQLSTSKDLPLLVSFIYSVFIVFTLKIYLDCVLKRMIDRYLIKTNAKRFLGETLLAGTLIALVLTVLGYLIFRLLLPLPIFHLLTADKVSVFFGMLSFTILFSGVNFGLELLRYKTETEKQEQILRNTLLEMEIDHLRTQLSPHFTFNILNNLQFLIRKDKDEALEMLSRYSNILRYYVYESKNKWIRLNDELSFLKHYFHLEKGRSGEDLQLDFNWNVPDNNLLIIPFVLSTFVENAFKHVSTSTTKGNFIQMQMHLQRDTVLFLHIRNTFDSDVSDMKKEGVGLKNAKKRLQLAYPDNYQLKIGPEGEWFEVQLELNLSKT